MNEQDPNLIDLDRQRAAQAAPSETTADEPTFARLLAAAGLFATVLGVAAIVANQYGPRIISTGWGVFLAALGFAALAFHALRDTDPDIRRMYGFAGMALLAAGTIVSIIPGRSVESIDRTAAFYLLPWGFCLLSLGVLFLAAFIRSETDTKIRNRGLFVLLGFGVLLTLGSVLTGLFHRDVLLGPGLILALLGLVTLLVFGSLQGVDVGLGRNVAVGMGACGGAVLMGSLLYALVPTILHDGPTALLKPNRSMDYWKLAGRVILILLAIGSAWGIQKTTQWAAWAKLAVSIVLIAFAIVLMVGSFASPWDARPKDFLVPHGLILAALGALALALSLATCSDSSFVVLARREFVSLFVSPMAYLVLFGATLTAAVGYLFFIGTLVADKRIFEPIVREYWGASVLGALVTTFLVPSITMRLFAEEKRSGTLEVLLTAPVGDWPVIFSKFFAGLAFYVVAMLPAGLFLIPLRVEGGSAFDSRPVLSFYLMVFVCGASFVAAGVFFSSFTRNQIVAAVLTFAWLMFLFLAGYIPNLPIDQFGKGIKQLLSKLGYFTQWQASLSGQLALSDLVLHASIAAFWLFLTGKVLEARKWM